MNLLVSIVILILIGAFRGGIEASILHRQSICALDQDFFPLLLQMGTLYIAALLAGSLLWILLLHLTLPAHLRNLLFPFAGLAAFLSIESVALTGTSLPFEIDLEPFRSQIRESSATLPSILLVSIDTLRADHLGCYGYPESTSPFLDALSRHSNVYTACRCPVPATTPSHASLLTGVDPVRHGSRFNAVPIVNDLKTAAESLQKSGYRTRAVVSAYPLLSHISNLHRGFDRYSEYLCPGTGEPLLYRTRLLLPLFRLRLLEAAERRSWITNRSAFAYLRIKRSDPMFMWVHYYDPHLPYDPPKPYLSRFSESPSTLPPRQQVDVLHTMELDGLQPGAELQRELIAGYDGEIAYTDQSLQKLFLRFISTTDRDVLCVVIADHGESLTEHNYFFSHSRLLFDPSLHVPLTIYDSRTQQAKLTDRPVPITIATRRILEAGKTSVPDQPEYLSGQYAESAEGVYINAHQPKLEKVKAKTRALILNSWKLIALSNGQTELYDLELDPGELHDCSAEYPEITRQMKTVLNTIKDQEQELPVTNQSLADEIRETLESLGYFGT